MNKIFRSILRHCVYCHPASAQLVNDLVTVRRRSPLTSSSSFTIIRHGQHGNSHAELDNMRSARSTKYKL